MTPIDRFERQLPMALTDLADPRVPDYFVDILGQTARTRQRSAWASIERWLPMADIASRTAFAPRLPWRTIAVALLILALIVGATLAYVGAQRRLPTPFGPAANGLIAYAEDGDLYVGDPITGESQRILGGTTADIEPAFSRDGTRMAFLRLVDADDDQVFRIMAMDADGTDVVVVTPDPLTAPNWWDWTPSGDIIVAARTTTTLHDVTVYDGDGRAAPRTLTRGIEVDAPVYRPPDGKEILFRGKIGETVALYVMNADGTNLRPLIDPMPIGIDVNLQEPRYSPDGSRIAYHEWDGATDTVRLFVMNADGSSPRELGARPGIWFTGWPVWSNDGSRIAASHAIRDAADQGPFAVIDVATDTLVRTGPVAPASGSRFEWAPDDSSILMSWSDGSRQVLLDPDGGPAMDLPWGAASYPSWQRLAP